MKAFNLNYLGEIFDQESDCKYMPPLSYAKKIKTKKTVDCCPLCGNGQSIVVGHFKINRLINDWVQRYVFNPIPDCYLNETLEKKYCKECGLFYYNYHLSDSEELYNELCSKTSYYHAFRQEYGMATEYIERFNPQSLLEIGSGCGYFLDRMKYFVPSLAGSEYNQSAK